MTRRYKNRVHRALNDMEWMGDEDGYDYSEPHKKLRRNKIDGVIGGVCAGVGDYIGLDAVIVRILTVISFFISGGITFWAYVALWIFVPSDKRAPYHREYREARRAKKHAKEQQQERPVRTASFRDVKSKFRSLETRMQDLEKSITSKEWQLRRDFRDLEN